MARIAGVDLPRDKRIEVALTYIYGIGLASSKQILSEIGMNRQSPLGGCSIQYISRPLRVVPYSSAGSISQLPSSSFISSLDDVPVPIYIFSTVFPATAPRSPSFLHPASRDQSPSFKASERTDASDLGTIAEKSSMPDSAKATPIL